MKLDDIVNVDPETLGGTPVFRGTRVPIRILFQHLEAGENLDVFLDDFPSVSKDQAISLLAFLDNLIETNSIDRFREIAA